ncbi:MAG: histone deacetylase family protein [Acetobacteraceae bacterium]|nr:histone deacetylase family protein [Acetobacteraceae bacterium]
MKVFWDPRQQQHTPGFFLVRGQVRPNFEVPARADALLAACQAMPLDVATPPRVPAGALESVHDPAYLSFLRDGHADWAALPQSGPELVANIHPAPEMIAQGGRCSSHVIGRVGWFTADAACPIGPHTWEAAKAAAAGALAAADEVAAGRHAYALARPPGHHAYRARAGGHCYLNNAALAAERLRAHGVPRVAVLDIDSHHGNGTQGIFWERDDVLYVSVHGDPNNYYPWFVGHAEERGGGAGTGCNLNLPLPIGTGDAGWLEAIATGLEAIRRFDAGALVVSLGFDASKDEPLNALAVTENGFARAGEAIGGLRLPAAIIQEGGYNTGVIGDLLTRFLTGLGVV